MTLKYDGAVYTGQVLRHGYGSEVDRYGNRYEGQWSLDERSGQGKMTFIDGTTYEGNWKSGKFHGIGILTMGNSSMLALSGLDGGLSGNGLQDHNEDASVVFKA